MKEISQAYTFLGSLLQTADYYIVENHEYITI